MRALVINTAFLGDLVFTAPLIENLARAGYAVDLVARPRLGAILRGLPGLQAVHALDKRGRHRGPLALRRFARALPPYDLVLGAHPSIRSGALAALTRCRRRIGWGPVGYTQRIPRGPRFVEDALALAEAADLPTPVRHPRLVVQAEAPVPIPRGTIALLPGARWSTKRWPHYAALAARLEAPVLLTGSASERPLGAGIEAIDGFGWPLPETMAALARCAVVIGGDSGLAHAARALGVPVLMLFGPTPSAAHPPDPKRVDLRLDLPCSPCSPHGPQVCPLAHHACLRELSVEAVLGGLQGLQPPA